MIHMAVLLFEKIPDISTSAAEDSTCLRIWHSICIRQFKDGVGLLDPGVYVPLK